MHRVVRSRRVVTPAGVRPADVVVRDGVIAAVVEHGAGPAGAAPYDAGDLVVMPGVVDSHVHVNEPGRTDWEGFATATAAAAAGGITTIVDMPLNCSPVTTSRAALDVKRAAIAGRVAVDVAFWGGLVPGNAAELEPMLDAGVVGCKAFLCPSGLDEFPHVGEADLRAALPALARRRAPLIVHAELPDADADPDAGAGAGAPAPDRPPARYATYLASRPHAWEDRAIDLLIALCREYRAPIHVVHLSSAHALPAIAAARAQGLPFTVETCPHYLTFDAAAIPDGGTEYKCAPPIRDADNRERLWAGLRDGTIDLIVSDHSPCTPALKRPPDAGGDGDFLAAWGGIASVQLLLSAAWTGARARGGGLPELAAWLCAGPARLAGLARKGRIAPGCDADLTVWDPDATFVVDRAALRHRHKLTPYHGRTLQGVVHATLLRGEPIFSIDRDLAGAPRGALLERGGSRPS